MRSLPSLPGRAAQEKPSALALAPAPEGAPPPSSAQARRRGASAGPKAPAGVQARPRQETPPGSASSLAKRGKGAAPARAGARRLPSGDQKGAPQASKAASSAPPIRLDTSPQAAGVRIEVPARGARLPRSPVLSVPTGRVAVSRFRIPRPCVEESSQSSRSPSVSRWSGHCAPDATGSGAAFPVRSAVASTRESTSVFPSCPRK